MRTLLYCIFSNSNNKRLEANFIELYTFTWLLQIRHRMKNFISNFDGIKGGLIPAPLGRSHLRTMVKIKFEISSEKFHLWKWSKKFSENLYGKGRSLAYILRISGWAAPSAVSILRSSSFLWFLSTFDTLSTTKKSFRRPVSNENYAFGWVIASKERKWSKSWMWVCCGT